VISKVLIDRIATIAAGEQDIRVGIDLVRGAVQRTEEDGRRRVTPGDLAAAARAVTAPALQAKTARLSDDERALLCRIAETSVEGAGMAVGAVFEAAQDYPAIGRTACHEHLNALAKAGIIDLVPGTGGAGASDPAPLRSRRCGCYVHRSKKTRIDRQPGSGGNP